MKLQINSTTHCSQKKVLRKKATTSRVDLGYKPLELSINKEIKNFLSVVSHYYLKMFKRVLLYHMLIFINKSHFLFNFPAILNPTLNFVGRLKQTSSFLSKLSASNNLVKYAASSIRIAITFW